MDDRSLHEIERSVKSIERRVWVRQQPGAVIVIGGIAGVMALSEFMVKRIGLQAYGLLLVAGGAAFLGYRWTRQGRWLAGVARKHEGEELPPRK